MKAALPIATLLSQALVAFTIECDNEAEHRIPHNTTHHASTSRVPGAPWLTSMVMWANCLRHLEEEPISLRELERRARTPTNIDGMRRWRYITLAPDPAAPSFTARRTKPPKPTWLVMPTAAGRASQKIWSQLPAEIEVRWRQRFGDEQVDRLREALYPIVTTLNPLLPDCLPILGYGLLSIGPDPDAHPRPDGENPARLSLFTLLSRTLLAFALEFGQASPLSLAICANPLRVLTETGVRMRDLPTLTGVSKESISMAMGILRKASLVVEEKDTTGGSSKWVRLTATGIAAQSAYQETLREIEEHWQARYGMETMRRLREPLEELAGDSTPDGSPLFDCLKPYPDAWRAAVRPPQTLPHFPMVLHRGGYPDGS